MKLSTIVTGAALAAVLGAGAAPAFAGEMSNMPAEAIQAAVVPPLGQAQDQLAFVDATLRLQKIVSAIDIFRLLLENEARI